jgi:hypothetical protein
MAIVDPFDAPAAPNKGIVDPFEKQDATEHPRAWSDVPGEAAKNLLPSAYRDIVEPLANIYSKNQSYGALNPFKMAYHVGSAIYNDPSLIKKIPTEILNGLVESYGSEEGLKKKIATDPTGFALDLSMLVGGGEAVASRVGRGVGEIARAADVSKPFYDLPREPPPPPSSPPPIPSEIEQAQQRLDQRGMRVDIPRALTFENPALRAGSVALSKAPIVGTPLDEAVRAVPAQMGAGVEALAQEHSPALPENIVGGGIEQTLSGTAKREAADAQAAAEADHATRVDAWEKENQAREQAITARQAQANNAATRAFGDVAPMEMAQDTISDVQDAARRSRERKDRLYSDVNDLDARVHTSAFSDLRPRAEQALSEAGVDIDDPGSNASRMLRELDRLSGRPGDVPPNVPPRMLQALQKEYGENIPASVLEQLGFPGGTDAVPPDFRMLGRHAPAPGANAVAVQGLEHLNKRIGRMGMEAESNEDRFASRIVKGAFDDWRNDALGSHLTPDSEPNARPVIDAARAAHRDLMERFGYNYRRLPEGEPRNAAKTLNQIVTGGIGPEGLRDNLIGAKPGNRRVSAPLYEAIRNAVPNGDEFRNRLRGAYWNTMSEGGPNAVARNVGGFTPTRMGSHLFEPHEHDLMRGYAQLSQQTPEHLREAARIAKQSEPKLAKVEPGRAEQLASKVLGRNRSDEQVLGTLDRTMRRGGDIKTFAKTWGRMTDANRDELRGAWLRNMGGGGEHFSVDKFVKNWDDYSPQAKAVMLDREHRQSMQDFYTLAKQYGDNLKKYGNPSGTAQVSAWHNLLKGTLKTGLAVAAGTASVAHPIGVAIAGLGLRGISKVLATPQGARQLSRWGRIAQAYDRAPSATKLIALQSTTRLLENSSQDK